MPVEKVIADAVNRLFFDLVLLACIAGFYGALICGFLQSSAEKFADKLIAKKRALDWKKRQEMHKAANTSQSEETTLRGEPARHAAAALREGE